MLQRYTYDEDQDDDEDTGLQEICDPGETLARSIERITKEAKTLADTLGEQVKYLAKRHKLADDMAKLEKNSDTPIRTMEKRVALLTQIATYGYGFNDLSEAQLKERISLIETIRRLEPNEQTPIKKLRERARLLERIEAADDTVSETEDA